MTVHLLKWSSNLNDPSLQRCMKPRQTGITMVIDHGLGLGQFKDLLELSSPYIDYIKLAFGTSVLYPQHILKNKIQLAAEHNVKIYPGGTLLEVAVTQGEVNDYFNTLTELGIKTIEISDGTISIPSELRRKLILDAKAREFEVITEYGKKIGGSEINYAQLATTLISDIECGASYVIVEGRDSGTGVGIYNHDGTFDGDQLLEQIESWAYRHLLLWEAPQKKQQTQFIRLFGPNVNLGNIYAGDILSLEALRRGLRSDTFNHSDFKIGNKR